MSHPCFQSSCSMRFSPSKLTRKTSSSSASSNCDGSVNWTTWMFSFHPSRRFSPRCRSHFYSHTVRCDCLQGQQESTSVGIAASKALLAYFGKHSKWKALSDLHSSSLSGLLAHPNAVIQMRALDFCLQISLSSGDARRLLHSAGNSLVGPRCL